MDARPATLPGRHDYILRCGRERPLRRGRRPCGPRPRQYLGWILRSSPAPLLLVSRSKLHASGPILRIDPGSDNPQSPFLNRRTGRRTHDKSYSWIGGGLPHDFRSTRCAGHFLALLRHRQRIRDDNPPSTSTCCLQSRDVVEGHPSVHARSGHPLRRSSFRDIH